MAERPTHIYVVIRETNHPSLGETVRRIPLAVVTWNGLVPTILRPDGHMEEYEGEWDAVPGTTPVAATPVAELAKSVSPPPKRDPG